LNTHTHSEMHSLAVYLSKAGYGSVAEMEATLKEMVLLNGFRV